jgi:transcriptional regulator with XRE-family HTH domain
MTQQPLSDGSWIPEWTLSDRLRKARLSTGLQQKDFAERIGVTASAYSQWEAGNNGPRDVVTIAKRIELMTRIPATWTLGLGIDRPSPGGDGLPRLDSNQQPSGYAPSQVTDLRAERIARRQRHEDRPAVAA